ncbi:MAG: hypothetical protein K6G15_07985 [Desulfovibrio sp.]|nr:hypothetical protein [Desulfovibrio sp.]
MTLEIHHTGRDLLITIFGGAAHIGAVAVAEKAQVRLHQCQGHREGEIAQSMAKTLAMACNCTVCVVCGIHYDKITKEEIALVLQGCKELENLALHSLRAG